MQNVIRKFSVFNKFLGLAGVAALLSACAAHVGRLETTPSGKIVERIYNDMGGHVATEYAAWQSRRARDNISHYVLDGNCASFCSFQALAAPDTCYTRSVRLGVHPASIAGLIETDETREFTRKLVARWPRGLQNWWAANRPSVLGRDLLYADLIKIIPERECTAELEAR